MNLAKITFASLYIKTLTVNPYDTNIDGSGHTFNVPFLQVGQKQTIAACILGGAHQPDLAQVAAFHPSWI